MALVRINVNLEKEVKEWYQEEGKKIGVSMTAVIAMALYQWKEQKQVMAKMQSPEWAEMLEMIRKQELED